MVMKVGAIVLACMLASCSVALMKRVPPDHQDDDYPDCSSGVTMPLGDAVLTVITGATAVNLHSAAGNPGNDEKNFRILAWSSTAIAVAFLASATYGAVQRNRCRHAHARYGYTPRETMTPNRPPAGSLGGRCRKDGSCDGDLLCDGPMKTCIQIEKSDKTLPPPSL